jgi:DNA-directed RNA polymerase specialized sigma24 family protein
MHHSGKSGQQRGTSRKEDILNVVINLKHPSDYSPEMGAFFEVHFEKGRELFGNNSKPFMAKLVSEEATHLWEITDMEDSHYDQVVIKSNLGLSPGDIAVELGLNKSTISRHQKRAREEGRIKKTE